MIELDLSIEEAELLFNMKGNEIVSGRFEKPIKLNGLYVMLTSLSLQSGLGCRDLGYGYVTPIRIKASLMPIQLVKSKQQVAAEEAVKKAEEALQAAKATLEKIKED